MDGGENAMVNMEKRLKGMEKTPFIDCPTMYYVLTGEDRVGGKHRGEWQGAFLNVDFNSWSSVTKLLAIVQRFRTHVTTESPHYGYYDDDFQKIEKAIKNADEQELAKALQSLVDTIYLE